MEETIKNKANVKMVWNFLFSSVASAVYNRNDHVPTGHPAAPLQTYRVTINSKSSRMRTVRKDIALA
jgi:hypothetical protein